MVSNERESKIRWRKRENKKITMYKEGMGLERSVGREYASGILCKDKESQTERRK